jgi:hypothetical protein
MLPNGSHDRRCLRLHTLPQWTLSLQILDRVTASSFASSLPYSSLLNLMKLKAPITVALINQDF